MAVYDYRCRECDRVFEVRRAIEDYASLVCCPEGHRDVARLWSAVSVGGLATASAPAASGGCCGGGCCG